MSIKTSPNGYVKIKRYDLYGTPCVPTGKVRERDNKTEAEFILLYSPNTERRVWLSQEDIML